MFLRNSVQYITIENKFSMNNQVTLAHCNCVTQTSCQAVCHAIFHFGALRILIMLL
jgi:hypothetical protein